MSGWGGVGGVGGVGGCWGGGGGGGGRRGIETGIGKELDCSLLHCQPSIIMQYEVVVVVFVLCSNFVQASSRNPMKSTESLVCTGDHFCLYILI